jgi:hypothetical protein
VVENAKTALLEFGKFSVKLETDMHCAMSGKTGTDQMLFRLLASVSFPLSAQPVPSEAKTNSKSLTLTEVAETIIS